MDCSVPIAEVGCVWLVRPRLLSIFSLLAVAVEFAVDSVVVAVVSVVPYYSMTHMVLTEKLFVMVVVVVVVVVAVCGVRSHTITKLELRS